MTKSRAAILTKSGGKSFARYWLPLAAALVWGGCGKNPRTANVQAERIPIVLFSIDTLRADRLGCYGYRRGTSPRIDSFAQNAVLFREAVAQAPFTAPSHMSIFTSLYPPVHQILNYNPTTRSARELNKAIVTMPQFLRDRGYLTVGLTGGAQLGEEHGFDRGFDYYGDDFRSWEGEPARMRPTLESLAPIKAAIRHWILESRREGRPLFLFLHHYICHDPYVKGPAEYREKFLDRPAAGLPRSMDDLDISQGRVKKQFFGKADPENPDHLRHYSDLYDGGVYFSDAVFGEIVDLLKEEGLYDRALIVLVADHGEEFREHGGHLHSQLFREVLRVPLIVKFPGGEEAGRIVDCQVETLGLFPTIADFLGLAGELPPVQGRSLLPLARGKPGHGSGPVSFSGDLKSVRFLAGDYIFSTQPGRDAPEWLFAAGDIEERRNLADSEEETVRLMRKRAREIMEESRAFREKLSLGGNEPEIKLSPERARELRALGYMH